MAEILAGQIVRAVDLNYPVVYQEPVSGGPTSGTTELVVATLVVPAQPIDTIQLPTASFYAQPDLDGSNDRWIGRIKDTNTSGTSRAGVYADRITGSGGSTQVRFQFSIPAATARSVPAGTPATYVATVVRSSGDGTLTTIAGDVLQALILPDRS